jgi:hypothetical protein
MTGGRSQRRERREKRQAREETEERGEEGGGRQRRETRERWTHCANTSGTHMHTHRLLTDAHTHA